MGLMKIFEHNFVRKIKGMCAAFNFKEIKEKKKKFYIYFFLFYICVYNKWYSK